MKKALILLYTAVCNKSNTMKESSELNGIYSQTTFTGTNKLKNIYKTKEKKIRYRNK